MDFLQSVGETVSALVPINAPNDPVPRFESASLKKVIPCYRFSITATNRQKRAVMTALTLCGRCTDVVPSHWQSYVISFTMCVMPEIVRKLTADQNGVDYTYEDFPEEFIHACETALLAVAGGQVAPMITFPVGLPNASAVMLTSDVVLAAELEGLYAYYAMIVFIMGKSISADNIVSIGTKRPDALIRKRNLQSSAYILTGAGRMMADNYKWVQSGWIRSTRPRIIIVQHLAILAASSERSESLDAIAVNMDLLRNSGQSYIFYIHELLVACPWAVEIPSLRAAYYLYVRMCNVLNAQPAHLKPYYKLMMQDNAKEVRRRGIEPLIAVATFFAAQNKEQMNQYRIDQGSMTAIRSFKDLAMTKGIQFHEIANQALTEVAIAT